MMDEDRMSTTDDPGRRPATRTFTVTISPSWLRDWGGRLVGATLLIVGACVAMVPGARQAYGSTITGARVTDVRDVAAVVSWKSSLAETGSVNWAAASGGSCTGSSYSTSASDLRGPSTQSTVHYVKLENLAPSTLYCYRPVSGSTAGDAGTFTTGPTLGAPGSPDTQAGLVTFGSVTATETIVYATLTVGSLTSAPFSTLIRGVDQQGYFAFSLSSARTADLSSAFSATGATLNLTIEGGDKGTGAKTFILATPGSGESRAVISATLTPNTSTATSTATPSGPTPTPVPTGDPVTLQFSPAVSAVSPGGTVKVDLVAVVPANTTIHSWIVTIKYDPAVITFLGSECMVGIGSNDCELTKAGPGNIAVNGVGTNLSNISSILANVAFKAIGSEGASSSLTVETTTELSTSLGVLVQWVRGPSSSVSVSRAPTVSQISPNQAWSGGGSVITITGTNFMTGATVQFGGRTASTVTVVNSTTITAKAPPVDVFGDVTGDGQVRLVDAICVLRLASKLSSVPNCPEDKQTSAALVVVVNPGGQSGTSTSAVTYSKADVNGDGAVRLVDAICVLRRASKLADVPNCPSPVSYP